MIFCVFALLGIGKSQYSMDFGLNMGAAFYVGEIGNAGSEGFKPFLLYTQPKATTATVGGFYRYHFKRKLAARFNFNWVRISAADSLSDEGPRVGRNLSFRTDIIEFSVTGEYDFFIADISTRTSRREFAANAYLGIGYILFYPTAVYEDIRYSLRPLATEGIENEYGTGTMILPMGVNFNFTFSNKWRMGMDFGYRFSFTDYLDDVITNYASDTELPFKESRYFANRSAEVYAAGQEDLPDPNAYTPGKPRGNPDTNDGYFAVALQISYVIQLDKGYKLRPNRAHKPNRNRGWYRK